MKKHWSPEQVIHREQLSLSVSGNTHPQIRVVYFNGGTAERAFRRHVRPRLPEPLRALPTLRLPSTSPAHAGRSFEAKRIAWSCLLEEAGNAQKNETPSKDSPKGSEV